MPTAAESLTKESSKQQVDAAVSSCIKQLMEEGGRKQEQCIAICMAQAREATGAENKRKSTRIGGSK